MKNFSRPMPSSLGTRFPSSSSSSLIHLPSRFKMLVEFTPDYAVDIPLIWQYIGEILGETSSLRSFSLTGDFRCLHRCSQFESSVAQADLTECAQRQIQTTISIRHSLCDRLLGKERRGLVDLFPRMCFQSQSHLQKLWHSSSLSLDDLLKSDLIDESMVSDYQWLTEGSLEQSKENLSPRADPQLVKLFKSFTDQPTPVTDPEIIAYIQQVILLFFSSLSTFVSLSSSTWTRPRSSTFEILFSPIWKHA